MNKWMVILLVFFQLSACKQDNEKPSVPASVAPTQDQASTAPEKAFTCYLTLAKDNCWARYNITVEVLDVATSKTLATISVPDNQTWIRQSFACQPSQTLQYKAQFQYNPNFFEQEKNRIYTAKNLLELPSAVQPQEKAWNLSLCYSTDFAETPPPPEAISTCQCDFSKIPPAQ